MIVTTTHSVEGRPILVSEYGHGPEAVLVVGGIHGNEPAGAALPKQLCAYLEAHPAVFRGKRVVVAAAVNPDGLAAGTRTNAQKRQLRQQHCRGEENANQPRMS